MSDGRPCYYVNEPGVGRVLIPGCMGAAVYGKNGCTCDVRKRRKDIEDKLEAIAARLTEIEAVLNIRRRAA